MNAAMTTLMATNPGMTLMKVDRRAQLLAEEAATGVEDIWWLSFCDPGKPKGSQFLGIVVTRALGFVSALEKARELGVNPGGECRGYVTDMKGLTEAHFDRLLSKAELDAIDAQSVAEE